MGSDSLRDLPTWHEPERVLRTCEVLGVMRRPDSQVRLSDLEAVLPGVTARVRWIGAPLIDLSSKEIRRRVGRGEPYRYWVPDGVADVIERRGLYREES